MDKNYTKQFQKEIVKKHLLVAFLSVIVLMIVYMVFDYVYNGAIVDFIDDFFGYDIALFVKQNQIAVVFMVLLCVLFINSLIIEIYAIQKISTVFSQMKILFQKNDQHIILDASLKELENDLNDLKRESIANEQKAIQETQHKVDMIAYLAHDIKTPLASVIGYLCLLDETYDLPEELRQKYTHMTLEKAYRLEKLINEFFDIAKLNQTYLSLQKEDISLYYMLEQMKEEFYPIMKQKNQNIQINVPSDMLIYVDAQKMARVFNNILKNAFYYGDKDSTVIIQASQDQFYTHISFINDGPQIPVEKLNKIFEQFYRLDESRSSATGGSGLGLSIAKLIVEKHHGSITVTSQDHTCFKVSLPKQ